MSPARTVISAFCFIVLAGAAQAHIVTKPDRAEAGSYFGTNLIVSHGCDSGAATTAITVQIPKEIVTIRPQMKPGWTITIKKHMLDKPIVGPHGAMISEVTDSITWTGTLPDEYFDSFGLSMKLPDQAGTLYFPTNQICGSKGRNWQDVPKAGQDAHQLENPAPMVTVMPAMAAHAHGHRH